MGVRISTIAQDVMTMRASSVGLTKRSNVKTPELGFKSKPEGELRAGFGKNTISGPTAALHTIDTSVQRAREMVPTMEEVREAFNARQDELKRAREEEQQRFAPRLIETAPSETTAQTGFAPAQSDFKTMASAAEAANPFAGTPASETQTARNNAYPAAPMVTPQLNILV